ncbi:hypothetical protein [Aquimarina sp. SS2-1]|uniref:hypothetical protein n=1 Tax=Aquimarina besae TaxID=3342247 RepID=UPI00366D785A
MEKHLKIFKNLRKKLAEGEVAEIRVTKEDEVLLNVKTKKGSHPIRFNTIVSSDGILKIDGIEM